MNIRFITYDNIDAKKWDSCIADSQYGNIYCTFKYLTAMALPWDAVIADDYKMVIPLPTRTKFGIHYIYPAPFTQQLGITSTFGKVSAEIVQRFLDAIPAKFKYIEANFNHYNELPEAYKSKIRLNHILPLYNGYAEVEKGFNRSAKRNIERAIKNDIEIREGIPPNNIIDLHRARFNDKIGVSKREYDRFEQLTLELQSCDMLFTIAAIQDGRLIAGSIFLKYKNRLTFILNGNSKESLHIGATHLLLQQTIKKFSNQNIILDFEGSDDVNFAKFYKSYGAIEEPYKFVTINRLPFWAKLLKK